MKRQADLIAQSEDEGILIYVDNINSDEIADYIEKNNKRKNRFEYIKKVILNGSINDCFKREIVDEIRDVYAMRFDLHSGNGRIYCKVLSRHPQQIIIMSEVHESKKVDSLGPKEKSIIRKVNLYEYEL